MLNPKKALIESYSSSHHITQECILLREAGFSDKTFSETLAIISTPYGQTLTGLGVKLALHPCRLLAWIYPGTRLYTMAQHAIAVNVVQPRNPVYYLKVMLGSHLDISLEPCKTILGRCIAQDEALIYVEATISGRSGVGENRILLSMAPLLVRRKEAITYSRTYGCIVEIAIAFTRVKFYARAARTGSLQKQPACRSALRNFERLALCVEAVLHSTADTEHHRASLLTLKEAKRLIDEAGCIAYAACGLTDTL